MEKRKIHLAESIPQLIELTDITKVQLSNIKSAVKLLDKVYQEYEKAALDRDEELSFIYLMRFLELFTKSRKVFLGESRFLSSYVGDAKVASALTKAEEIKSSLTKRYESLTEAVEAQITPVKEVNIESNEPLTVNWLYEAIKQNTPFVLVDTRSSVEFYRCTVRHKSVLNVPSDCLRQGSTVTDIDEIIKKDDHEVWQSRSSANLIIIMDWDSAVLTKELSWLIDALWLWDAKKRCSVKPRILQGGLKSFLEHYPTFVTDPDYAGPAPLSSTLDLDSIAYPDMRKKLTSALKPPSAISPVCNATIKEDATRKSQLSNIEIDRSKKPTIGIADASTTDALPQPSHSSHVEGKMPPVIPERSSKPNFSTRKENGLNSSELIPPSSKNLEQSSTPLSNMKRCTSQPNLTENQPEVPEVPLDLALGDVNVKIKFMDNDNSVPRIPNRDTKPNVAGSSEFTAVTPASLPVNHTSTISHNHQPNSIISLKPSFNEFTAVQIANFSPLYKYVKPGLTGLRNMGNTCYMSSVIQALSNTKFLVTYLRQPDTWRHDINPKNPLGNGGVVVMELANVIQALWSEKYACVTPLDLRKAIINRVSGGSLFAGYEQHDSQEFLAFLLDGLHEDLNAAAAASVTTSKTEKQQQKQDDDNDELEDSVKAERTWKAYLSRNDSVIVNLFQGMFRSEVRCSVCSKVSVTFEPFQYLSLPLPETCQNPRDSRTTLSECLALFQREEAMRGASRWSCPRCRVLRDATKRITLYKLPPYLLVHLKRFSYTDMTHRQKISCPVDYPLRTLDLTGHLPSSQQPHKHAIYQLYAVSNHHGNMESGHYTSYCRNWHSGRWFNFDDEAVSEISEREVKTASAYILFYESDSMQRCIKTSTTPN